MATTLNWAWRVYFVGFLRFFANLIIFSAIDPVEEKRRKIRDINDNLEYERQQEERNPQKFTTHKETAVRFKPVEQKKKKTLSGSTTVSTSPHIVQKRLSM